MPSPIVPLLPACPISPVPQTPHLLPACELPVLEANGPHVVQPALGQRGQISTAGAAGRVGLAGRDGSREEAHNTQDSDQGAYGVAMRWELQDWGEGGLH